VPPHVEGLLRALAPQALGALARRCGDFCAAEDAVQEALLAAAVHWSRDGVPEQPLGWLVRTGSRKLIDERRSARSRREREELVTRRDVATATASEDDSLTVLFLCCHPALTPPSAIALTLRAVGGLTTAEVASAFLVDEATMAQRISRAKARIRASGMPFRPPAADDRPLRLRSVQRVLYLMFNEGYAASRGSWLQRTDLTREAMRLTQMAYRLLPGDGEVAGLLALMLLLEARRAARTDAAGELVPLAKQNRALWDDALIAEGTAVLNRAVASGSVGEYTIQAAIAAIHDRARQPEDTDWPQILALYGLLEQMTGSPIVTLNRAVATAMVSGPEAGLTVLGTVDGELAGHHRLDAVRAHLLELAGDAEGARRYYRAAASRTTSLPEQRYLTARAAGLYSGSTRGSGHGDSPSGLASTTR
jgi:RNA polymerase sigma factor (sigma-70 family)